MLSKKEIIAIFVSAIIIAFVLSPLETAQNFLLAFVAVILVIGINVTAKKISSFEFDSEIEVGFWEASRFGFNPESKTKKPIFIGIILTLLSLLSPIKNLIWMAVMAFDVKAKTYRAAKRHGLYSFSEMTEDDIGYIAASGITANLIFAIIGYLIGANLFAEINIFYAFFNLIPISNLDGNKIFFGNTFLWSLLAAITSLGVVSALIVA